VLTPEVPLVQLRDERVLRIDHVADAHPPGLGEQLVGLERLEAVVLGEPADQLDPRDPGGVLHRASAADGHQLRRRLDARPADRPSVFDVDA
jgi:hypothetical protein